MEIQRAPQHRLAQYHRLHDHWMDCRRCGLWEFTIPHVLGVGDRLYAGAGIDLLVITEAPGLLEALKVVPVTGAPQIAFQRLLERSKLSWYLTPVLACRPCDRLDGQNRPPQEDEIEICSARIMGLIDILSPRTIVLLGEEAKSSFDIIATPYAESKKVLAENYSIPFLCLPPLKDLLKRRAMKKAKQALLKFCRKYIPYGSRNGNPSDQEKIPQALRNYDPEAGYFEDEDAADD